MLSRSFNSATIGFFFQTEKTSVWVWCVDIAAEKKKEPETSGWRVDQVAAAISVGFCEGSFNY